MSSHTEHTCVALRESTLDQLAETIVRPGYNRQRILPGIVHIGVGSFNRSHLAVYLDGLPARSDSERWGEFSVGLLPADEAIHAALTAQDFLYGLLQVDNDEQSYRVVGWCAAVIERLSAAESLR